MSRRTKIGWTLAVIGVVLFALGTLSAVTLSRMGLGSLLGLTTNWWLFLVIGLALVASGRLGYRIPQLSTRQANRREDIIRPTNWVRTGKHALRKSFGVGLIVSGVVMLLVSLVLQKMGLVLLWVIAILVGVAWVIAAWRFAHEILHDHTHTISVRAPDLFALHSFHIALRQTAEDLGYRMIDDVSPGQGGQSASYSNNVFHAEGGFTARKRPISESETLVPELEDDPYLSSVVTLASGGVFTFFLGIMVLAVAGGVTSPLGLVGLLVSVAGILVVGYDYARRTREWGELYCVEEGTATVSTVNVYEDDVLEQMDSHVDPTITGRESSGTLSVTLGAKATSLYDEDELERDFQTLVDAVEAAAADNRVQIVERTDSNATDDRPRER